MSRFLTIFALVVLVFYQPRPSHAAMPVYSNPENPGDTGYVPHDQFKAAPYAQGDVSRFLFSDWGGKPIPVWTFVPSGVDVKKAPIMFMMHGALRNPARYLLEWVPHAQKYGFVVIAPEFAKQDFKGSRRYNSGYMFGRSGNTRFLRAEPEWAFSAIEPIFDHAVKALQSNQIKYTLYGHSAGSQFVHRFLYYKPDARVKRYLAANAGWYTMPDLGQDYPYGLKKPYGDNSVQLTHDQLKAVLGKDVIILLGDQDTDEKHKSLNRSKSAMKQGLHRFDRGAAFLNMASKLADKYGVEFGWRGRIVKNVAHSNGGIAQAAAPYVK